MSKLGVLETSVGSGLNAGRNMNKATRAQFESDYYEPAEAVLNETPEMVISENVRVTGLVTFKRLFRVDGTVEGKLDAPKDVRYIFINMYVLFSTHVQCSW